MTNDNYLRILYTLLGVSIFVHYWFVVLFTVLILIDLFFSGEYKKILKDRSLIVVEIVLGFSIVMAMIYDNWYGLIAIPILLCVMVGRYYTLIMESSTKKNNLELLCKVSVLPFVTGVIEYLITRKRAGYFAFHNPNYLGSVMMMIAVANLYFAFEKKSKWNFMIFFLNIATLILSGSRSALIGITVGVFVLFYYFFERKYFIATIVVLVSYIIGVIYGFFPFLREKSIIEYFWLRVDIIKIAIGIFEKTNILYGHGNFYYYKFTNFIYPHSHNALVESLLSYGVVGTLALLVVFLRYIYEIMKNNENNILKISLILGVIAHNSTDFVIFWIQTVLLFIMILSYTENNKRMKEYGIKIYSNHRKNKKEKGKEKDER
ncbi:MAG: O-antigen ligase family protein [Leptotrichia sp.]|nr:O-antigen ligase family protein [Leptotrichia sp.]